MEKRWYKSIIATIFMRNVRMEILVYTQLHGRFDDKIDVNNTKLTKKHIIGQYSIIFV